jgi:hypothetical protein
MDNIFFPSYLLPVPAQGGYAVSRHYGILFIGSSITGVRLPSFSAYAQSP